MNEQTGKIKLIFTIVFVSMLLIAFALITKTAGADVKNDILRVRGLYGINVPLCDIIEVKKLDTLPAGGRRTNGLGIGPINIGHFKYDELGSVRLCVLKREAPYILVITENEKIIINIGKTANEELYKKLIKE